MSDTMHDSITRGQEFLDALLVAEHDWAAYDSSDIHHRTQEWEAQVEREREIEFFVPRRKPVSDDTRERMNAVLERLQPGVCIGRNLRQHTAFKVLSGYVGAREAARIMLGG